MTGLYHILKNTWKQQDSTRMRELTTAWRQDTAVVVIDKPTRLDRAHSLGYKAKKGFIIVRVRVKRGGRKQPRPTKGRRSKRMTIIKTLKMNNRWVAEIRAQKTHANLEVLNSYYVGQDGQHYFFEVILVDPDKTEIKNDPTIQWITLSKNQGRVFRGLTSAGKQSRGLRNKGPMNKNRPSVRAGKRRGK